MWHSCPAHIPIGCTPRRVCDPCISHPTRCSPCRLLPPASWEQRTASALFASDGEGGLSEAIGLCKMSDVRLGFTSLTAGACLSRPNESKRRLPVAGPAEERPARWKLLTYATLRVDGWLDEPRGSFAGVERTSKQGRCLSCARPQQGSTRVVPYRVHEPDEILVHASSSFWRHIPQRILLGSYADSLGVLPPDWEIRIDLCLNSEYHE